MMTSFVIENVVRSSVCAAVVGGLFLISSATIAEEYSASVVEMRDSSVTVALDTKSTADVLSEHSTIIYREADLEKTDVQPALLNFQGDVVLRSELGVVVQTDWLSFDPSTKWFSAVEVHVATSGKAGGISLHCSSGQLFVNGEGTGTYPTQQNPRTDILPSGSVYCNGNTVHFRMTFPLQEP